jgi:hypothetical protein
MVTLETEICFLSGQEARAWEIHSKPPARCDKNVHQHVTQGEARKMCSAGEARLAYVRGRWCLIPENPKRGYEVRSSAGYVGLQLVAD